MSKLLVIVGGPTASGKTGLAIFLAKYFNTAIVSSDSRQFFKELSIGTAKPSQEELNEAPHYFINSHSVTEEFNAGAFAEEATVLLEKLFKVHDVVILAGGSGLYIDALINGIDNLPMADPILRTQLEKVGHDEGISKLQEMLKELDPVTYGKIDTLNPRRMIRAIEVTTISGKPYSELLGQKKSEFQWPWIITGIDFPREELYRRINERTSLMIHSGLLQEAKNVITFRNHNALKTVGYKEMFEHLDGNITIEETELLIAKNTRNYAKRQLTWFRRYPEMIWLQPGETDSLVKIIENKIV